MKSVAPNLKRRRLEDFAEASSPRNNSPRLSDGGEKRRQSSTASIRFKLSAVNGGHSQIFDLPQAALLRFPNTYFSALLRSGHWKPGSEGCFEVNRDPKGFDLVVEYLREGFVGDHFASADHSVLLMARQHFDYFLIPIPEEFNHFIENRTFVVEWNPEICSRRLKIRGDVVSKAASSLPYHSPRDIACVLGTVPNPRSFKVALMPATKLVSMNALVGLSSKPGFQLDCSNVDLRRSAKHGFYIHTATGTVISQFEPDYTPYKGAGFVKMRSTIEVRFDLRKREIVFIIDEVDCGVAFTLPRDFDEALYPAIELNAPGDAVRLLHA